MYVYVCRLYKRTEHSKASPKNAAPLRLKVFAAHISAEYVDDYSEDPNDLIAMSTDTLLP